MKSKCFSTNPEIWIDLDSASDCFGMGGSGSLNAKQQQPHNLLFNFILEFLLTQNN